VARSKLVQNPGELTGFATFVLVGTTGILGTLLFCLPGCSWLIYCFLAPWCWGIERGTSSRVLAMAGFLCGTILVAAGCIFLITDTTGPYLGALLLLPVAVVAGGVNFGLCTLAARALHRRFGAPLALAAPLCWLIFECNLRYTSTNWFSGRNR